MMSESIADSPSIEDLAEEFLERRRLGERPTMEDYAARYPHLAGEIREFFPVLGLVEDFKPSPGESGGRIEGSRIPGLAAGPKRLGDFRLLREVGRGAGRPASARAIPPRGEVGRPAAPHQHRPGLRGRRA